MIRRPQPIPLLVSLAAIMGFSLWSQDILQGDIQGAKLLLRMVNIRAAPEFQVISNQPLQILKPLYGLSNAGDNWHATFARHLASYLGMAPISRNLLCYARMTRGALSGFLATHVDDTPIPESRNSRKRFRPWSYFSNQTP